VAEGKHDTQKKIKKTTWHVADMAQIFG